MTKTIVVDTSVLISALIGKRGAVRERKGITKLLLWEEYSEQYPNRCYSYSRFCEKYRRWRHQQRRSMRQTH
ncbi:MAG: hypothetical protein QGI68_16310, partial [Pseudomonadales bacterium]|nr:hypothetical protein [Pseudomonadales bacterium]